MNYPITMLGLCFTMAENILNPCAEPKQIYISYVIACNFKPISLYMFSMLFS